MSAALSLDSLDITDAALYVSRGYPFREWDLMRREAPVFWYERPGFKPFWAITKHADVLTISRNSNVFVNSGRLRLATIVEDEFMFSNLRSRAEKLDWDPDEPHDMIFMDDPRHKKFRLLTARQFTPAALRKLEVHLEILSKKFADEFQQRLRADTEAHGSCDFVDAYAVKLPLATIGEMLGLPEDDWRHLKVLTNVMLNAHEPDYYRPGENVVEAIARAAEEMRCYMADVIEQRRAAGAEGNDLASILVRAQIDGAPLTDQQLQGYLTVLLGAGNETTRNATSGGVQALLEHPDQCAKLCANPELLDSAVEEILRWTSPVVQFARTAVKDFEIRGQMIRAGEDIGMFYPSANRDEDVFENPYDFDIERSPNLHLAFGGYGAHFCLGANLARSELRAMMRSLLPILPEMELAGPEQRVPHLHVPAIQRLPVRYAPRK
jgi:cholest-4-en-3-one 26-monooxygenase